MMRIEQKREAEAAVQARQRDRVSRRVADALREQAERVESQRIHYIEKQDVEERRRQITVEQRQV